MLVELGLNSYEAKSYLALLEHGGGSGYSVAKNARIPTSKVYEALKGLQAKGFVLSDRMDASDYKPVPPEELIEKQRSGFIARLDAMAPQLDKLYKADSGNFSARLISGGGNIIETVSSLIRNAQKKLLLTAWPEQLEELRSCLQENASRIEIFFLVYGSFSIPGMKVFTHRRPDLVGREIKGRTLLAVSDKAESVIASFNETNSSGIFSSQSGIASIVADHILHDISLNHLFSRLPEELAVKSEKELTKLRKKLGLDLY
jgi:sugar-specific transcriptional regulator TrmB